MPAILLSAFLFVSSVNAQLGYDLSKDTILAFRKLHETRSSRVELVKETVFKNLLDGQLKSSTFEVPLNADHWEHYRMVVADIPKSYHDDIASRSKSHMNSDVSQTSSDRKFWQNVYAIHRSYTK